MRGSVKVTQSPGYFSPSRVPPCCTVRVIAAEFAGIIVLSQSIYMLWSNLFLTDIGRYRSCCVFSVHCWHVLNAK